MYIYKKKKRKRKTKKIVVIAVIAICVGFISYRLFQMYTGIEVKDFNSVEAEKLSVTVGEIERLANKG